jgi:MinD superfamily P-loop ATPase
MKIVILSGKGGTGKTSVAASLAVALSQKYKILLVDADVDCPNEHLVFEGKEIEKKDVYASKLAVVKKEIPYEECEGICQFDAIKNVSGKAVINPRVCEGCGACAVACPDAFELKDIKSGEMIIYQGKKFNLVSGKLLPGEKNSGKVVHEIRKKADEVEKKENIGVVLIDSAAGIGCPVIASVMGCNYAIAVVEPTPASISSVKRALEVVKHFAIPYSIVINKVGLSKENEDRIRKELGENVIGEISYDEELPKLLANKIPPIRGKGKAAEALKNISKNVEKLIEARK